MKLQPIRPYGIVKPISSGDLCSSCQECIYLPGKLSGCNQGWPGLENGDGQVQRCKLYCRIDLTNRQPRPFASFA